jgi:hypothetical protein
VRTNPVRANPVSPGPRKGVATEATGEVRSSQALLSGGSSTCSRRTGRYGDKEAVLRFLIVGAGALGGYYGGMLLRGGADVTFLVRPRRAAQLAERGLVIKEPDGEFTTPVKTVLSGAVGGRYDVVFLACKAYASRARSTNSLPH